MLASCEDSFILFGCFVLWGRLVLEKKFLPPLVRNLLATTTLDRRQNDQLRRRINHENQLVISIKGNAHVGQQVRVHTSDGDTWLSMLQVETAVAKGLSCVAIDFTLLLPFAHLLLHFTIIRFFSACCVLWRVVSLSLLVMFVGRHVLFPQSYGWPCVVPRQCFLEARSDKAYFPAKKS